MCEIPIGYFEVAVIEYAGIGVLFGKRWRSHDRFAWHPVGGGGAGVGIGGLKCVEYPYDFGDVPSQ